MGHSIQSDYYESQSMAFRGQTLADFAVAGVGDNSEGSVESSDYDGNIVDSIASLLDSCNDELDGYFPLEGPATATTG